MQEIKNIIKNIALFFIYSIAIIPLTIYYLINKQLKKQRDEKDFF